tara:strand:+ start:89 stop:313 length:225 start_codon:yes stop_codon:yes gene_type:complete
MPNFRDYDDDDFELQPKYKDGVKQKGYGGSKKNTTKRKKSSNSTKEIYNSKHIRIQAEKMERCRSKRVDNKNED